MSIQVFGIVGNHGCLFVFVIVGHRMGVCVWGGVFKCVCDIRSSYGSGSFQMFPIEGHRGVRGSIQVFVTV